jgi:hypothetical protein
MPLYYSYDANNFMYLGSGEADESPLEPGVYHIPAHSTLIVPPEFESGYFPRWAGESWELVKLVAPPPVNMPALTARQIRLGLLLNSITSAHVDAAIAAMPEGVDKEIAKIEWEYATTFNRAHPLVAAIGAGLGLSLEQIDQMWAASAAL